MSAATAYESWGRYPRLAPARVHVLRDRYAPLPDGRGGALLAWGLGRSYGDSCQIDGGTLIDTRRLDHFVDFDPATGRVRCEAGVRLADVLALAREHGWCLPVTPGTQFVTVGGAIANDVHGKNHHRAGTFGDHLLAFELLRSGGETLRCSPAENAGLFRATIGGLGLTGLVVCAEFQLAAVAGSWIDVETIRFANLDEFMALSGESDASHEYTAAWLDCVAKGSALGRGIFMRGNHTATCGLDRRNAVLTVPVRPPMSLVNPVTLRAFNHLYYHRHPQAPRRTRQPFERFMYPLDRIRRWNLLYGPRGFVQYQCVVCRDARDAIAAILERIAASGQGSFLAVLKAFGDRPAAGLCSFARPGLTLALDFPFRGEATLALLEALDGIVVDAAGAVYPAKDARMSAANFRRFFPHWEALERHRDPAFMSSFWRRVSTGSER